MKDHNGSNPTTNMPRSYGVYDANYRESSYRESGYRDATYRETDYRDATYRETDYRDSTYRDSNHRDSDFLDGDYRETEYRETEYRQPDYRQANYRDTSYRYEPEETYVADTTAARPSTYRGLIVNASGDSTVIRSPVTQPQQTRAPTQEQQHSGYRGCFSSPSNTPASSEQNSFFRTWCRPTILLLFLVLLVVIFVLVSGILLYHNCMLLMPILMLCTACFCLYLA